MPDIRSNSIIKRFAALGINDDFARADYKESANKIDTLLIKAQQKSLELDDAIKQANGLLQRLDRIDFNDVDLSVQKSLDEQLRKVLKNRSMDDLRADFRKKLSVLMKRKRNIDNTVQYVVKKMNDNDIELVE